MGNGNHLDDNTITRPLLVDGHLSEPLTVESYSNRPHITADNKNLVSQPQQQYIALNSRTRLFRKPSKSSGSSKPDNPVPEQTELSDLSDGEEIVWQDSKEYRSPSVLNQDYQEYSDSEESVKTSNAKQSYHKTVTESSH